MNIAAGGHQTVIIHDVVWEPHPEGLTIPKIDSLIVEGDDVDAQIRHHLTDRYGWPVISFRYTIF